MQNHLVEYDLLTLARIMTQLGLSKAALDDEGNLTVTARAAFKYVFTTIGCSVEEKQDK
jgi:hypothetical protein